MDPRIAKVISDLSQLLERYSNGRLTTTGLVYEIIEAANQLRKILSMEADAK